MPVLDRQYPRIGGNNSQLIRWFMVLLAPAVGMMSSEPYGIWWLMLVSCWLLFTGLKGMSPRMAVVAGFICGTALYGATLSWLWNLFDVLAIFLWMILGTFTAVFCYFYRMGAMLWRDGPASSLLAAVLWTGIEFFRSEVFVLRFSWITPGTVAPPSWLSPVIGTYGVTFLIVFTALLFTHKRSLWLGGTVLALVIASIVTPRSVSPPDGQPIRVVAVQNEGGAFQHHLGQSASVDGSIDLLVWPEHAVPYDLIAQERQLGELQAFLKKSTAVAVVGTRRMDETREAPDGSSAWFNMACAISADAILGYHDKNHPVHFFNDGIPGTEAKPIKTPFGKIGTPVCFDVDFQDVVRRMTLHGAIAFVAPTMDAESWSARQHLQHAHLFRHRAAENGRWMTVAATSGVTQIIDATGTTRTQIPLMLKGVLDGYMSPHSRLTFFTRWGWMFGPICMWSAAVLVVVGFPVRWMILTRRSGSSK